MLAAAELAALADLRAGKLRLAGFPSACATLVPRVLALLGREHPGLDIRLTEVEPPRARALVAEGEADLALLFAYDDVPEPDDPDVVLIPLTEEPVFVVLPPQHALAAEAVVPLSELRHERWVAGCPSCRAHLLACTAAAGYTPDIRHSTDDYVVTQTLVAAGLGVALLPRLALAAARSTATVVKGLDPPQQRQLYLAHGAGAATVPAVAAAIAAFVGLSQADGLVGSP